MLEKLFSRFSKLTNLMEKPGTGFLRITFYGDDSGSIEFDHVEIYTFNCLEDALNWITEELLKYV